MPKIGDTIDPHGRILLETTYEAICDAGIGWPKKYLFLKISNFVYIIFEGISPQSIRGSKTGVYIGNSTLGMPDGIPEEIQKDLRVSRAEAVLTFPGNAKSIYANRVSFVLNFKGPSMVIDTACSSSMAALDIAITDLRLGNSILEKVLFLFLFLFFHFQ
jgi:acyl transferase domain-containing protein